MEHSKRNGNWGYIGQSIFGCMRVSGISADEDGLRKADVWSLGSTCTPKVRKLMALGAIIMVSGYAYAHCAP